MRKNKAGSRQTTLTPTDRALILVKWLRISLTAVSVILLIIYLLA